MNLSRFEKMVFELRATNGKIEKQNILKEYESEKDLLGLILNPFKKFNVTAKGIQKTSNKPFETGFNYPIPNSVGDLKRFLLDLSARRVSGENAKLMCLRIMKRHFDFEGLLLNIFDKDLKIGMGTTEVNKVFPDLVPEFHIQKATKTTDKRDPEALNKALADVHKDMSLWTIQRKLDGVRVAMTCENGKATPLSSYGNEFNSIDKVCRAIEEILPKNAAFVLDGEICVIEESGVENFTEAVSQIKRKSVQMERPCFVIFDLIPLEDFWARKGKANYATRYKALMFFLYGKKSFFFKAIHSYPYSEDNFAKMMDVAEQRGWEGLMLKKNASYSGRRSKLCYKVKKFEVEEFIIDSINVDVIPMPDPATKLKRDERTMKSVNIIHQGNEVNVGSGWNVEQRREFFADPDKIIGRTISVQFQGYSQDKKGKPSLRIPTLKHLWGKERDV